MAIYITLVHFTEQGIRDIQDSPRRADNFAQSAHKLGVTVKDVYWTSGKYDGVLIFDAPDDETASALTLHLARLGNVRTTSLRAYKKSEIESILSRLP